MLLISRLKEDSPHPVYIDFDFSGREIGIVAVSSDSKKNSDGRKWCAAAESRAACVNISTLVCEVV